MIDQTLKGRYRLYERVGAGSFGSVYLGRDLRTNVVVAVKILHPQHVADPTILKRFRAEAELAHRIHHPNVVQVLDFGREGEQFFLVLEYVQGHTLAEIIQQQGRLSVGQTVQVAAQTLAALEAAYLAGVVHRDIKPQNLMLADGLLKVMDFGIARDAASGATLTQIGMYVGTPHYMAPEVAQGSEVAQGAKATIRSDLYALGVTLYQCLAGRVPFEADSAWGVIHQHINTPPPSLAALRPDAPPELVRVIERALAKRPEERYPTPREMLLALQPFATGPLPPRPAELRAPRSARLRPPELIAFGALGVLMMTVAIVLANLFRVQPSASSTSTSPTTALALITPIATLVATPTPASTLAPTPASAHLASAAPLAPSPTPSEEADWQATLSQLDSVWGKDWDRTILLLDTFLDRYPDHAEAKDKLYAALFSYGQWLTQRGDTAPGVAQLQRAQAVEPDRGEAAAALLALTPTPVPTATPTPAPGDVLLADNFDDPSHSVFPAARDYTHYKLDYVDGEYSIQQTDPNWDFVPDVDVPGYFSDASIAVDARLVGPIGNRYIALACRDQQNINSSEYRLEVITDDDAFRLDRWDNGNENVLNNWQQSLAFVSANRYLIGWQASRAIRGGGQANRLELSCAGDTITARVNDVIVASVHDSTYTSGGMWIGAARFSDSPGTVEARFDNLVVTQR